RKRRSLASYNATPGGRWSPVLGLLRRALPCRKMSKKNFAAAVPAAVPTRAPEDMRPLLPRAQDEGRFGRIREPRRAGGPPGGRPRTPRKIVREYSAVYAAVAPAQGKLTALQLPYANTAMMQLFLNHVGQECAEYFSVRQVDRAGWHVSHQVRVPENRRLIP